MQVTVPLLETLVTEMRKATDRNLPFNFSHYIMICKLFKTKTDSTQDHQVIVIMYLAESSCSLRVSGCGVLKPRGGVDSGGVRTLYRLRRVWRGGQWCQCRLWRRGDVAVAPDRGLHRGQAGRHHQERAAELPVREPGLARATARSPVSCCSQHYGGNAQRLSSLQLSAARAANPTLLQQHAFVQLVLLNIGLCLFILLFVYKIYNTWINSLAELCQVSLTLTNNNNGGRMQVVYLWSWPKLPKHRASGNFPNRMTIFVYYCVTGQEMWILFKLLFMLSCL